MKEDSITYQILETLMNIPGIIWDAFDRPYSLAHRIMDGSFPPSRLSGAIHRLKKQNFIGFSEKNGKITLHLTEKGRKKLLTYKLDKMKIKKPKIWDEKWRLVIFDIPEARKLARNILREKIANLGLKWIQDSVWIHPYPIDNEIRFLAEIYEIRPFVKVFIVESLNDERLESSLKKKFNLS